MNTYLPDMWNQCAYRQCIYGPDPWINLQGQLSVHDERISCPSAEAVPLGFISSESNPCMSSDVYCAGKIVCSCTNRRLRVKISQLNFVGCSGEPTPDLNTISFNVFDVDNMHFHQISDLSICLKF